MFCKNCGYELIDSAKFCLNCGTPLPAPTAPSSKLRLSNSYSNDSAPAAAPSAPAGSWGAPSAPAAAPSSPTYTTPAAAPAAPSTPAPQAYSGYYNAPPAARPSGPTAYGTAAVPAAAYCMNCGAAVPGGNGFCVRCGQPVAPSAPKQRRKKLLAGLIAGAAVIAAVIVGIVFFSNKQTGGPIKSICSAAENTLKAGCTIEVYDNDVGYSRLAGTVSVKADPAKRELIAVSESEYSFNAVYKGYEISQYHYYYGDEEIYKYDISDQLDVFFDVYEVLSTQNARSLDLKKFCYKIDPSGDVYEELCDHVDEKVFQDCLQELVQKMNDQTWLEENAGLTVSAQNGKTTYTFNLSRHTCKQFLRSALEILKPAFRSKYEYEEFYNEINDIRPFDGGDAVITFIIEGNKLVSMESEIDAGYYTEHAVMEFVNIGTTVFDTEMLDDMLKRAYRYR